MAEMVLLGVETGDSRPESPIDKSRLSDAWILLPSHARKQWRSLLARQKGFLADTESYPHNQLALDDEDRSLGAITTGIARNYYVESLDLKAFRAGRGAAA